MQTRHLTWCFFFISLLALAIGCSPPARNRPAGNPLIPPAEAPVRIEIINEQYPGRSVDPSQHVSMGKHTIFEFYSDNCVPSTQMLPLLEKLTQVRRDLAVKRININRPGESGIDFASPAARDNDVHLVPYFKIYDPQGRFLSQDAKAKAQVKAWMQDAGIVRRD
ncbi:MAG: thioredoxin family protein [Armatimonadetes bacterium]|nr:thioredoxin family protein [Armatimonadota bacterium]